MDDLLTHERRCTKGQNSQMPCCTRGQNSQMPYFTGGKNSQMPCCGRGQNSPIPCACCQERQSNCYSKARTDSPRRRRCQSTPERMLLNMQCGRNFPLLKRPGKGHHRRHTTTYDQKWEAGGHAAHCSQHSAACCSRSCKMSGSEGRAVSKHAPLAAARSWSELTEPCCSHRKGREGPGGCWRHRDEGSSAALGCSSFCEDGSKGDGITIPGDECWTGASESCVKDIGLEMQTAFSEGCRIRNDEPALIASSSKEDHSQNTSRKLPFEDKAKNGDESSYGRSGSFRNVNENRRQRSYSSCSEGVDCRRAAAGHWSEGLKSSAQRHDSRKACARATNVCKGCEHHDDCATDDVRQKRGMSDKTNAGPPGVHVDRAESQTSLEDGEHDEYDSEDEEEEGKDADTDLEEKSRATTKQQRASLTTSLYDLWRRRRLCDVVLRAGEEEVPVHRLALAASSSSFARRYCQATGDDVGLLQIDVPGASAAALREVLRFVYTQNINITPDNVEPVLAAAHFLHIDDIVTLCKQVLMHPDVENVIYFFSLMDKYRLSDNLNFFYDFICKYFLQVYRTQGWRTLTYGQVMGILSNDSLNVNHELDVFYAALAWIEGDRSHRLTFAPDLIGCVRFGYITPGDIAKHVETKHFLFQGDEGKELLLCVFRHHALQTCACKHGKHQKRLPRRKYRSDQDVSSPEHQAQGRQPHSPRASDIILAAGGINPFQPEVEVQARNVQQYSPRSNHWNVLTRLPDGRHHHGLAALGGCIYVIGGSVLDELNPGHLCNPTASCYRYQIANGQWSAIAPLNTARMYHGLAVLTGLVFVFAGQTHHSKRLSSVEFYRPDVDEWEVGPDLGEARIGMAGATYKELLFAVGGFLETEERRLVRDTVQVYDHRTRRWTNRNPLPSPRCHAALAVSGGKLFLLGGSTFPCDSSTVLSLASILRYDDVNDRWEKFHKLRVPRHDMGVAVLGTRIFVVGGVSSAENQVLNDVECLDVEGGFWLEDIQALGNRTLGLSCVALSGDG